MSKFDKSKAQAFLQKIPSTLCGQAVYVTEWTVRKRSEYENFVRSFKGEPINVSQHRDLIFKNSVVDEDGNPLDCDPNELPVLEVEKLNAISSDLNTYDDKKIEELKKSSTQTAYPSS